MEIDVVAIAGMIFSLLVVMAIGGLVLLYPLSRRLGALLEDRLDQKRRGQASPAELGELREAVRLLEAEVHSLAERQAFTESLLEPEKRSALRAGGPDPSA